MKVILDSHLCTGCGVCVAVCPQMILEVVSGKMRVKEPQRCMGCFGCEDECPSRAVRVLRAPQMEEIAIEPSLPGIARCDVAVVGAGPAGLGAAIACARAGLDVVVFERLPNRKISHHTDGGILFTLPELTRMQVTPGSLTLPELDLQLQVEFARPCREFGLLGPLGLASDNRALPGMEAWAGCKDLLVNALADEAEKCGARLWFNARVVDLLHEEDRVCGVKLTTGEEIRSHVVVTADGAWAKISEKAGLNICKENLWYAPVLSLEFENDSDLPASLYYLNGGMQFEPGIPPALGGIGVTQKIHVMVGFFSQKKDYPASKPIDSYAFSLLEKDPRVRRVLGDRLAGAAPVMLSGCRGILRERSNLQPFADGVVSVGDAWVDGGELGNIPALANGVFAGRVIVDAAKKGDFSKEALAPVTRFFSKNLLQALAENKKMKLLPARLTEEEMTQMFRFMQHMNYPTMMLGSPRQQAAMFIRFFLKNIGNFLRYPKIARLFFP